MTDQEWIVLDTLFDLSYVANDIEFIKIKPNYHLMVLGDHMTLSVAIDPNGYVARNIRYGDNKAGLSSKKHGMATEAFRDAYPEAFEGPPL